MPLNVLQVNYSDYLQGGGGAIAMYRLYQGLKALGVNGTIFCSRKTLGGKQSVASAPHSGLELQLRRWTQGLGLNDIHRISSFDIPHLPAYQQADLLNLHIIHSGYFNYLALPRLTRDKPAVFTLHDMWAFTGHCAYSFGCDRWRQGCGRCPDLKTSPSVRRDATAWEWRLKKWVYQQSNLAIVAPSQWLVDLARQSVLGHLPIHHIPYGLNTNLYRPLDRHICRQGLNLPLNKHILFYSAANPADPRKGMDLLWAALRQIPSSLRRNLTVVVMGNRQVAQAKDLADLEIINLGYVDYEPFKVMAYCAADLFVFPTRADNLPLVVQESLACGTPVVTFKVGGLTDMVRPGKTGYLAEPENAGDLKQGIITLLEDESLRQSIAGECRRVAETEYSLDLQAQRYVDVYTKLLN
jgi:glycosyltransferase involved in cell wall biosynthesis